MAVISAREFNHSVAAAQRAAASEPVIITSRGKPSFVLLSIDEYRKVTKRDSKPLAEQMMPEGLEDLDLETHRVDLGLRTPEL